MELFHPVLPQPFVVEDVLLDDSGVLAVAAEMIGENLVKEAVFGDLSIARIAVVLFHKDFLDPGIHREGAYMVKSEESDAVGHLLSDAVEFGQAGHGVLIA